MKLSLHMIVRNAEHKLARTLESAKSFVDEIVIVDTGSTDGTISLAESYGAQVFQFEWVDDFSKARNFALSKTSGDWITWFDAGDVLSPEAIVGFQQLRNHECMTDPNSPINYIMGKLNRSYDEYGYVKVRHATPRVVKRSSNPRWAHPIHEALIVDNASPHFDDSLVVDDPEGALGSAAERNLRIMERWIKEDADQLVRCFAMRSQELEHLGQYEEAVKNAKTAHLLKLDNHSLAEHFLCLGRCFLRLGYEKMAQELLLMSTVNNSVVPDAFILLGDIELNRGEWSRAVPYYRASLSRDSNHVRWIEVVSYYSYEPYEKLGRCYLGLGDKETALAFFGQAAKLAPPYVVQRIEENIRDWK